LRRVEPLESLIAKLPEDPDPARSASSGIEWDALLASATREGVDGVLLWHALQGDFSAPLHESLERELAIRRLSQEPVHASLHDALGALESAALRPVALKGPVLAERLYPTPFLRRSADVDLLVASRDLEAAVAALEVAGFRASESIPPITERNSSRCRRGSVELLRPGSPALELHFRLFIGFGAVLPAEDFLERTVHHTTSRGRATRVLAPEDELLYLAVHAAGHGFERLVWLYDMKLLVRRGLDADAVAERARHAGLGRAYEFAIETLARRLAFRVSDISPSPRSALARALLATERRLHERSRGALWTRKLYRAVLSGS
jgi:hypothetical protein